MNKNEYKILFPVGDQFIEADLTHSNKATGILKTPHGSYRWTIEVEMDNEAEEVREG